MGLYLGISGLAVQDSNTVLFSKADGCGFNNTKVSLSYGPFNFIEFTGSLLDTKLAEHFFPRLHRHFVYLQAKLVLSRQLTLCNYKKKLDYFVDKKQVVFDGIVIMSLIGGNGRVINRVQWMVKRGK